MIKYLMTALIAMTLAACSFDKGGDPVKDQKAKENERTKAMFDPIIGDYDGAMMFNGTMYDVQMVIGYVSQTDSSQKDDNGQPLTKLVPRATLKRINPAGVDYTFDVYMDPSLPRIELINVDAAKSAQGGNGGSAAPSSLGPNDIHSLVFEGKNVSLSEKTFIGIVKNDGPNPRGSISLKVATREQTGPGENPDQEYYNRLKGHYQAIAGDYVGFSTLEGKKTNEYRLTIRMRIDENGSLEIPVLYGTFGRTDDKTDIASVRLSYNYRTETKRLTMEGLPIHFPNSGYFVKITATVSDKDLKGTWTTNRGYEGELNLQKTRTAADNESEKEVIVDDQCLPSKTAQYVTLPEQGPIPTPRPKCP